MKCSVETAVRLYYEKPELGTAEIKELFGEERSPSYIAMKKRQARLIMSEREALTSEPHMVNTECAYAAWGIDVVDLEQRYKKLKRLELIRNV